MRLRLLCGLSLLLLGSGCESLYDTYTPVAAQMLILGVLHERGVADEIDFADDYVDGNVDIRLYLSEARRIEDVGAIPAEGAVALITGAAMGTLELIDRGGGLYGLETAENPDLRYDGKHEYELTVIYAGKERKAWLWLPDPPWTDTDTTHQADQAMALHMDPEDFDNTVGIAFADDGQILYQDAPDDLDSLLEFTSHSGVGSYTFPGEAFPSAGRTEAVGVAGIRVSRGEEYFEDMDADVCRLAAGAAQLSLVDIE